MKRIGIVGWSMSDNTFGVTKPYLEYFSYFGQVEILTPRKEMVEGLDLLVLPGGKDANPLTYGEVPSFSTSDTDVFKEYFFKQNLPQYIQAKVPVFGICLGMQYLNIFFNGKLTQDLLYHPYYSNPRTELVHKVYPITAYDEATKEMNYTDKGKAIFKVNSLHHQGIYVHQLGNGLIPTLCSESDELIEAFRHKELPIAGVQFHPEEIFDDYSINEIRRLLDGE